MKKERRIAFIFTSSREEIFKQIELGETGDTPLRGMNYIPGSDYFTILPKTIGSIFLIPKLLRYDFIIAQDNLFLGYLVSCLAFLLRRKTKWLYISITSSILIKSSAGKPLKLFLLKTFWKSYAKIICISSEQMDDFERIGIPRSILTFMPFCIDADFFKPPSLPIDGDIVVSVGRDAGRDYPALFRAAEKVPYSWTVVASRRNIPEGSRLPANVSVHYDMPLMKIRDLFSRARLLVVVSKDSSVPIGSDCSGQTVILEALAAGLPVIATHRAWMNDYFVSDRDIVIVKPNDPEELAAAINNLWNDANKRNNIAASGHAVVFEKYTTKVMARHLEKLMNSVA